MPLTLFKYWTYQFFAPGVLAKRKYEAFKRILVFDRRAHVYMAQLEEIYYQQKEVDCFRIAEIYHQLSTAVNEMVKGLTELAPLKYGNLNDYYKKIDFYCRFIIEPKHYDISPPFVATSKDEAGLSAVELGGKGWNLLRLVKELDLPVPPFLIITTRAFFYLLECLDMVQILRKELSKVDISNPKSLEECSKNIVDFLKSQKIPSPLEKEIKKAVKAHFHSHDAIKYSVRSSAVSEDSESSFAGQYLSVIGVPFEGLVASYKKVIESKYAPNAIFYRIKKGYCDLETPMAVIVQQMVEPVCAGVAYSQDPEIPDDNTIHIYVAEGQGEKVVSGKVRPVEIKIDRKTLSLLDDRAGRVTNLVFCKGLTMTLAKRLASWIMEIESVLDGPVDMEWCLDQEGNLMVLQARPLTVEKTKADKVSYKSLTYKIKPIISGGQSSSAGCAAGPVFKVSSRKDLLSVPEGAVLVSRTAPADYVLTFDRIKAMISEEGSPASHCSSVAREMGIPYICGMEGAFDLLENGQVVTVDADSCVVLPGVVKECLSSSANRVVDAQAPMRTMLKQLLDLACHLGLVDPNSKDFRPEGCRSLHDIIRFVHETSMREMFSLGGKGAYGGKGTKKLTGGLPFVFYVLDVGGGIVDAAEGRDEISIEHVSSVPMRAFWAGLTHPSVKWSTSNHFAWEDYDNVMLAGGVLSKDSVQLSSYAVLAADYMNLNVRFGYHFVQIDALCSNEKETNYITFRFSGGGGNPEGREQRTRFLVYILNRLGFDSESTGELVDAKIGKISSEKVKEILETIGRLVGATKLMDMYLKPETDIEALAEEFLRGRSDFSGDFKG